MEAEEDMEVEKRLLEPLAEWCRTARAGLWGERGREGERERKTKFSFLQVKQDFLFSATW